jgi:hypothetical protein
VAERKMGYSQLPGISPQQARDARARIWAFAFRCYESRKNLAADPGERGEYDGIIKEASADESIIRD